MIAISNNYPCLGKISFIVFIDTPYLDIVIYFKTVPSIVPIVYIKVAFDNNTTFNLF